MKLQHLLIGAHLLPTAFSSILPPLELIPFVTHLDEVHLRRSESSFGDRPSLNVQQSLELEVHDSDDDDPLPVVIWHGLGDSADNAGLTDLAKFVDEIHPGTYVHIINLSQKGNPGDKQESFFGNLNDQVEFACQQLSADRILNTAPAIDAIGFSQGGVFMRGLIERCGHRLPRFRTLITFGSPHNGIAEFQKCKPTDWLCKVANNLLKSGSVWSDYIQTNLIPAQYFRNPGDYENYLEHSNFLADVNNERVLKNVTYAENLAKLEKLVMVLFKDDQAVVPKQSAWFAEVNATSEKITGLRERPIYTEDWIGLKKLDEKGGLVLEETEGGHMELRDKDLIRLFGKYFGPL